MSRSRMKNFGGRSSKTDKPDKKIWHKAARSKINLQVKEFEKLEEPFEAYFNYDDSSTGDVWGWSSDGANWLEMTKSEIFSLFNSELKSEKTWNYYLKGYTDLCYFRTLILRTNLAGKKFQTKQEMDSWMLKNQNKIIQLFIKLNFGK